ncbi:hypothetical protein SO802_008451 [Lithocarpus litseifolius]|uniref:Uncharacterized protein n=1 Tax=Lithocarpus litseifolius TaxID=425828 RepID=A0AAW2DA10_9ROSI
MISILCIQFHASEHETDVEVYCCLKPLYNDYRKLSILEDDFEEEGEEEIDQLDGLEDEAHEKDYYYGQSPARERDRARRRDCDTGIYLAYVCLGLV